MAITYFAHLTTETGTTRILCKGQNYETVVAKLKTYRDRHFAKHQVWLGGFVLSYAS